MSRERRSRYGELIERARVRFDGDTAVEKAIQSRSGAGSKWCPARCRSPAAESPHHANLHLGAQAELEQQMTSPVFLETLEGIAAVTERTLTEAELDEAGGEE